MLVTRIVQAVLFAGFGWAFVMTVRIFVTDWKDHRWQRDNGLADGATVPIDYDGSMRRRFQEFK